MAKLRLVSATHLAWHNRHWLNLPSFILTTMPKILMPLGDATEALDTFYPFFRLPEDGFEVVVAGPEARLYHTVLHEIPPNPDVPWDITQERPGYHIRATVAFRDLKSSDYAGMFISGGRAPEYLRYDQDLLRVTREIMQAGKPVACVCHGIDEDRRPGDAAPSPESAVLANETRQALLAAINRLRDEDREIIAARFFLDLSETETAETLGLPRGTVKSRLSRALGRLREGLAVTDGGPIRG